MNTGETGDIYEVFSKISFDNFWSVKLTLLLTQKDFKPTPPPALQACSFQICNSELHDIGESILGFKWVGRVCHCKITKVSVHL